MRYYTRNIILTAVSILAILLLCPALQANTILVVTSLGTRSYTYSSTDPVTHNTTSNTLQNVGPYTATLDGPPTLLVFCLDLHLTTFINQPYVGDLSTIGALAASQGPAADITIREEEAAFLASNGLEPGHQSLYSPIQMAIWEVMNTLGGTPRDDAAHHSS